MNNFSSLRAETVSIGTLLQRNAVRLAVADWQRRYAWNETTAQQFFSSLWHLSTSPSASSSSSNQTKQYFIGCMYTSADQHATRLLDGQQRLVTCMLMIAAACRLLTLQTISRRGSAVDVVAEFGNLLFRDANVNSHTRLMLGSTDQLLFARILYKGLQREDFDASLVGSNSESSPALVSVYNLLVRQFKEKIGIMANSSSSTRDNRLLDFLYGLRDRVFVMLIDVPTVSMAVSVFSSINRPSIPLNDSDIFLAETMKFASSESDHRELRTQFDALRTALPEPDQLASLASIVRTILLQRCLTVAEYNIEHNKRHMKDDTLPTLRSLLESGSTHDFFAFVFESLRHESNQPLSLFSYNQKQGQDDWRCMFNLFVALGNGLQNLLAQSSGVSFLRVMALDVVVALRGENPWLLVDDSSAATRDALEENTSWLACIVLLATLENNNRRLICEQLLGNFSNNSAKQLCATYERLLLHKAKIAMSASQLCTLFETSSNEFVRSLLSPNQRALQQVSLIDRQYLLDFSANTKTFRWLCRYFLQRHADLEANSQLNFQATRNVWRTYQVEHICPRSVDVRSDWRAEFGWTADCNELDRLGNLTLVTAEQNALMSNSNWSVKRTILASLPVGFRVVGETWTMFDAEARRESIVNTLFNDWNISLQAVVAQHIQPSVQKQQLSTPQQSTLKQQQQTNQPPPKQQESLLQEQQQQPSLIDQQHNLALLYAGQLAQRVSFQQPPTQPTKTQKRPLTNDEETLQSSKRPRLSISRFPPTQTVYVVKFKEGGTFHIDSTCTNVQTSIVLVSTLLQRHPDAQLCQNCRHRNNL